MLRCWLAALGVLLCFVTAGCPKTQQQVLPPTVSTERSDAVHPGDQLEIEVRGQEDLTGAYSVAADGTIRFPRVGAVDAADRPPTEIARDIEARLADGWLRDPQVSVLIAERQNPEEVTVLGEVQEQGSYPHDGSLTLMKAISLAGGLKPEAHRRKVKLIRETEAGRRTVEVDVQAIIESRAVDLPVEPGDVIVVPESPI